MKTVASPFRVARPAAAPFPAPRVLQTEVPKGAEIPGPINGIQAKSLLEWRAALALWRWRWTFEYQVSFFGGQNVRGGIVVDFLVDTVPLQTPLFVNGERWHTGYLGADDLQQLLDLGTKLAGRLLAPVILWGRDLLTQEAANEILFQKFGVGGG